MTEQREYSDDAIVATGERLLRRFVQIERKKRIIQEIEELQREGVLPEWVLESVQQEPDPGNALELYATIKDLIAEELIEEIAHLHARIDGVTLTGESDAG